MPEPFNFSKLQGWKQWIDRFGLWLTVSEKSEGEDHVKKDCLLYAVSRTGEGSILLDTFTDLTDAQKRVYKDVKHFKTFKAKLSCRAAFNRRIQNDGESIDTFIADL